MKAKFLVQIIFFVLIACAVQSQAQNKQLLKQAKKGNYSKVEELLQNGADINYKDFLGYSALQFAVIGGHTVIVKLLLEKGANPNIQDSLGKTPLMYAIDFNTYYENKEVQIVNLLLQYGADTDIKNKDGLSAIDLALQHSPTDIYTILKPSKIKKEKNIRFFLDYGCHSGQITDWCIAGNNAISVSMDKTIRFWDLQKMVNTSTLIFYRPEASDGQLYAVAKTSDNSIIAVGGFGFTHGDKDIYLIDTKTKKSIAKASGHNGIVYDIDISSDNELMVSGSQDGILKIWDISDVDTNPSIPEIKTLTKLKSDITNCLFSKNSKFLFAGGYNGEVAIWERSGYDFKFKTSFFHKSKITDIKYCDTENLIIVSDNSGIIKFWNIDGTEHKTIKLESTIHDCAISFDNNYIAVSSGSPSKISIYEIKSGKKVSEFNKFTNFVQVVSFIDNEKVISADVNDLYVWDIKTNEVLNHLITDNSFQIYNAIIQEDNVLFNAKVENDTIPMIFNMSRHKLNQLTSKTDALKFINDTLKINALYDKDTDGKIWSCAKMKNSLTLLGFDSGILKMYSNENNGMCQKEFVGHNYPVWYISDLFHDSLFISTSLDNTLRIWNLNKKGIFPSLWEYSDNIFRNYLINNNLDSIAQIKSREAWADVIVQMKKNGEDVDHLIDLWGYSGEKVMPELSMVFSNTNDWLIWTDDFYYMTNKDFIDNVYFEVSTEKQQVSTIYPIDQFDYIYNRPDIILNRLGYVSDDLIENYYAAYQKRLQKLNITEELFSSDFHTPEIDFTNNDELSYTTKQNITTLQIKANDTKVKLNRLNIWVNGVPVFGQNGKNLSNLKKQEYQSDFEVELMPGNNKIQVSCLNENAAESYKETIEIVYEPEQEIKPNLYILGIGASEFQNIPELPNTDNDIREFVDFYKTKEGVLYQKVFVDTFINENVLRDDILTKKVWLQNTNVNDIVIIYYSGHGSMDKNNDYYLYSYNADITNIAANCIQYDDLENLLDGIPARRKLFLVNACHSGEFDENMKVFKLMKETFPELRKGTGAMTITSSYSNEWSYTDPSISDNNSAFGYAVEKVLTENSSLTVNELKQQLDKKVYEISNEKQSPTFRSENLDMDFKIW